eukprot:TRINITY_DN114193_c0_g1_i1.p1 TRINITY_DN114193_c0_g1~~TRINITY_DN114193_c0_g1_i1.p1  ORF type:complete len:354 (+),score=100.64 TRINITY_DN114193_c0_g1_i1:151-1212(+)
MIGFLLRTLMGVYQLPCMLVGLGAALAAMCGCMTCLRCAKFKCRDLGCVRWCLRRSGHDKFDDFDLLVHVHEAKFECDRKMKVKVRITAGDQVAYTSSSKGIFQSTMNIFVEQGTNQLIVDLVTESDVLLAQLKFGIEKDILNQTKKKNKEGVFPMKQKGKGLLNPSVRLTISTDFGDEEAGLLQGSALKDPETVFLMKQQLIQAEQEVSSKQGAKARESMHDLEVLMQACAGPVQVFGSFGGTDQRYVGVMGPPNSRRFVIGIWKSQQHFEELGKEVLEVEILKIFSAQADPSRPDVFVVSYFDRDRVSKKLTCRIVDRPAKLWVDFIQLIIGKVHEYHKASKAEKKSIGSR